MWSWREKKEQYNEKHQFLQFEQQSQQSVGKILKSRPWTNLKALKLQGNSIEEYIQQLIKLECPTLVHLNLKNTSINDKILLRIINKKWENLKQLYLDQNYIGQNAMKIFTIILFQKLQNLSLNHCRIGYQGAKYISKAKFPSLRILAIQDNWLGINGHLALLNIKINNISEIWSGQIQQNFFYHMEDPISAMSYVAIQSSYAPALIKVRNHQIAQHFTPMIRNRWKTYV